MLYALLTWMTLASPAHAEAPETTVLHGSSAVRVLALSYDGADRLDTVVLMDGHGDTWKVTPTELDQSGLAAFGGVFERAADRQSTLWVHGHYGQLLDVKSLPSACGVRCAETLIPLWTPNRSLTRTK